MADIDSLPFSPLSIAIAVFAVCATFFVWRIFTCAAQTDASGSVEAPAVGERVSCGGSEKAKSKAKPRGGRNKTGFSHCSLADGSKGSDSINTGSASVSSWRRHSSPLLSMEKKKKRGERYSIDSTESLPRVCNQKIGNCELFVDFLKGINRSVDCVAIAPERREVLFPFFLRWFVDCLANLRKFQLQGRRMRCRFASCGNSGLQTSRCPRQQRVAFPQLPPRCLFRNGLFLRSEAARGLCVADGGAW